MAFTLQARKIGDGGSGTIYSSSGFTEAVKEHGRPFGPYERGRILDYDGAPVRESAASVPEQETWKRLTDSELMAIYGRQIGENLPNHNE